MGVGKLNGAVGFDRRPPQKAVLERLRCALWDPDDGSILGRTPKRWGIIGLIYLVMYLCIVIFFAVCMCGLLAVLDDRVPYFTLEDSIIGNNPGMGHRPLIYEEGALIWYDANNASQIQKYIDNLNEFLAPYENKSLLINKGVNQRDCDADKPPREEVCSFRTKNLGPCTKERGYGYAARTPCIIIKLNKIYDWKPQVYDDLGDLPADMPPDLVQHINSTTSLSQRKRIWVSCAGEGVVDEAILGPLHYWPYPGLPDLYFPYDNTPGYLSPIVAVQLLKPKLHQIINIRCRAWARNIQYTKSLKERLGSTHIEVMID